ncbi:transcriptional repressor [bacterium]|nr:transcriptional repressor [bacterium]
MKEENSKRSRQRELILRIVRSTKKHPTADEVFADARQEMPNISMGTVYRNLHFLKEQGRIKELCFPNCPVRYDGDLRDHYHIKCTECGRIEDVSHLSPRAAINEIEELTGYQVHTAHIKFQGICPECQKKMSTGTNNRNMPDIQNQ